MRAVQLIQQDKIARLIQRLPDEIIRHIYETYFECKSECIAFVAMLSDDCSARLEFQRLRDLSMRLFRSPICVDYLIHAKGMIHEAIKYSYEHHYKKAGKHEKIFKLLDKHDSFNLSILMSLYH